MRRKRSPTEMRAVCARMVRREANCAESMGDPEGAGRLRDLAALIDKVRLTVDK